MADFELELQLTARIDDLEKGMKDAQRAVEKSSEKIERQLDKTAGKFDKAGQASESFTDKAAKMLAKLGALEGAIKSVGLAVDVTKAFMAAASGDADALDIAFEGMANTAKSLPFGLGAIASAIEAVASSIMGVAEAEAEAAKALERLTELDRIVAAAETFRKGLDDGNLSLGNRLELLKEQDTEQRSLLAIEHERVAALALLAANARIYRLEVGKDAEAAKALNALMKERKRIIEEIAAIEAEEVRAEAEAQRIAAEKARQEKIAAELARLKAIAEREAEKAKAEADRAAAKAAIEAATAAKELARIEAANAKAREDFFKASQRAQQEFQTTRAEAEMNVAQATATFSTAGGSFTTGVSAELNEAKLLTKISTASKELLAEIVRNTAMAGMGLV